MGKQLKFFLLVSLLCSFASLTHAVPISLDSGDSAVFTFDFSPTDISSANSISFLWDTTLSDGSSVGFFDMAYRLLDELGEAPVFSGGPGSFSPAHGLYWSPGPITDDPISFIEMDFFSADTIIPSSVLMSITANAYESGQLIASIAGVPSLIPAPATLGLLILGFFALGWTKRPDYHLRQSVRSHLA